MIIRTVRTYQPLSLVLIPLIAVALWLPGFLNPTSPSAQIYMPLFSGLADFSNSHPLFAHCCGIILSLAQAFFLNYIINHHQVLTKKSWLPALLFMVLSACSPGLLGFFPEMIAGLLLLVALHFLLGTYRADRAFTAVFNAGFFIGFAGLIYAPSLLFVLFGFVVILILRPFIWREWIIYLVGVFIPWIYSGVYFFWNDQLREMSYRVLIDPVKHRDFFLKLPVEYYSLSAVAALLLLVAAGRFIAGSGTSTLKTKKSVSVMIWFLVFSLLAVLPAQNFAVAGFLFCLYPVSLFISNYFLLARRTWIAEIIFILLLLSIATTYFLNKFPL